MQLEQQIGPPKMKMRYLSIILVLVSGCAASPEKIEKVADQEASRLQPATKPLSSFAEYDLQKMSYIEEILQNDGKLEEAQEFEENLRTKVLPLLNSWQTDESGGAGMLLIETRLSGLRIIGGANRFWAGGFAGNSFIDMDLKLIDRDTGETLSDVHIRRDSNSAAGAWTVGKSDQNLDDYVSGIVYEYLSDNY